MVRQQVGQQVEPAVTGKALSAAAAGHSRRVARGGRGVVLGNQPRTPSITIYGLAAAEDVVVRRDLACRDRDRCGEVIRPVRLLTAGWSSVMPVLTRAFRAAAGLAHGEYRAIAVVGGELNLHVGWPRRAGDVRQLISACWAGRGHAHTLRGRT